MNGATDRLFIGGVEIGTSQRRYTEVRLTHRWRELDSNFRFRAPRGLASTDMGAIDSRRRRVIEQSPASANRSRCWAAIRRVAAHRRNPAASARAALSAMRTHRGTGSSNPFHSSAESANYRRGRHVEAVMRLGRDRVAGESRVRRFRRSVPRSAAFRPMRRLPRGPDQISLPDKQAGIAQAVAPGSSPAEHRSGNGRRYDRPGEGSPRRGISYNVSRCPGLCEAAHNLLSFAKSRRRHGCARCA